jgi:hypothetical protein
MKVHILLPILILAFCITGLSTARSQENSDRTEERADTKDKKSSQEDDLEALRRAAEAESSREQEGEEDAEEKVFKSGNLGLQALNPEISVTGDMLGNYQSGNDDVPTTDMVFRGLGLHLEAYLDPYSRFKAAVGFSGEGAELEEVYFTRYGILRNVNLTLGQFRQQFGIVNRWHKHALDWFDFSLALRSIFGPGGLNQLGLTLEWSAATGSLVHDLMVQVTDADNPRIFGGNTDNRPSILGRYLAYVDVSPSTYFQIGATGLVGWNNEWETIKDTVLTTYDDSRPAAVYGADLVVVWEPTDRMRYRNIEWRSEVYVADKEIYAPDDSGTDRIRPWGFYSMVQTKLSRTIEFGVRYDYFAPAVKDYASLSAGSSLAPLAVTESDAYRQLAGAWLTWWQSPFVKFRGGYSYEGGEGMGPDVHLVTLQMVFAAGPHKHERY